MLPLVIVSKNSKNIARFVKDYADKNSIPKNHTFEIVPLKNEITISQIRTIKKEVGMQMKEKRLFVIYNYDSASIEAQNAFLKVLEEKTINNSFLLIVENEYALLPTIRSRTKTVYLDERKSPDYGAKSEVAAFINQLKILDKPDFLTSSSVMGMTKDKALLFFNQLIFFFRDKLVSEPEISAQSLKKILYYKSLLVSNNTNPQLSVDSLLIFIWKLFRMR